MFKIILLILLLTTVPFNVFSQTAGDKMNLNTGEYTMDMGGGDTMNLDTGEIIIGLGDPEERLKQERSETT